MADQEQDQTKAALTELERVANFAKEQLAILPVNRPKKQQNSGRWPLEVHEKAYQLWAWRCRRNYAETAEALNEEGFAIPVATIRNWGKDEGWRDRFSDERANLGDGSVAKMTLATLAAYAVDAADYLGQVVVGESEPNRERILAAQAILDRIGVGEVRLMSAPVLQPGSRRLTLTLEEVKQLPDQELLKLAVMDAQSRPER